MRPILPSYSPAAEGEPAAASSQALTLYRKPSLFARITETFSTVTSAVLKKVACLDRSEHIQEVLNQRNLQVPVVTSVFKDEKYLLKSKAHRNRSSGAIEKARKAVSYDRRSSVSVSFEDYTASLQPADSPSTPISPPDWSPPTTPIPPVIPVAQSPGMHLKFLISQSKLMLF